MQGFQCNLIGYIRDRLMFDFQTHIVDHKQCPAFQDYDESHSPLFPNGKIRTYPIIQIFGRDVEGQSICAHIHGFYPTIYMLPPPDLIFLSYGECNSFIENFRCSLILLVVEEWAIGMAVALNKALQGGDIESISVFSVALVKGRQFYFYSALEQPFVELKFTNPALIKRAHEWIYTTMQVQVFEAHVPFDLQFMIAVNLFGMDTIKLASHRFRSQQERLTKCRVELDCLVDDIQNPLYLKRYEKLREDASGMYPPGHVMPSVVAMLENLGLNVATQAALPLRPNAVPLDFAQKYAEKMKKIYQNIDLSESARLSEMASTLRPACLSLAQRPAYPSQETLQRVMLSSTFAPTSEWNPPEEGREEIFSSEFDKSEIDPPDEYFEHLQLKPALSNDQIEDAPFLSDDQLDGMHGKPGDFAGNPWTLTTGPSSQPSQPMMKSKYLMYFPKPPYLCELQKTGGVAPVVNQELFFSNPADVPAKKLHLSPEPGLFHQHDDHQARPSSIRHFVLNRPIPVSYSDAISWIAENTPNKNESNRNIDLANAPALSQIEGPTQKPPRKSASDAALSSEDRLVLMSVEVFADSTSQMMSNPDHDAIVCIFYCLYTLESCFEFGLFITGNAIDETNDVAVHVFDSEMDLLQGFFGWFHKIDPDIICGYEVQRWSWGYIARRSLLILNINLSKHLSRLLEASTSRSNPSFHVPAPTNPAEVWAERHNSSFQVYGRIVLNVWRMMRSDLNLRYHDFEFVYHHVTGVMLPKYSQDHLLKLYNTRRIDQFVAYHRIRTQGNLDLLIKTEGITRTCEFSRLFGVNFYSVISRGSQFKVESLMIRLAHLENFLMLSPIKKQVVDMRAAECIPLVMEPESRFYVDPVLVLDFQSLYPSIMMAYNYCYSTCIGPVLLDYPRRVGVTNVAKPSMHGDTLLGLVEEGLITVSPNRIGFVKPSVREGVLSKMCTELIEGRVAVKGLLAGTPEEDEVERRILDARQLGLKYIANVTYGYTSAAFSGRMPSVDIADSIVQTGRATLEKAVILIESNTEWNARVVYGDTDSLFVLLNGRSLEDAFRIGKEMAAKVTESNPHPVKLKFEKVYYPCVLFSKKRYVGFKYEKGEHGEQPTFDAKGIETVRRDSCPLVSKILEKMLKYGGRFRYFLNF